MDEKNPTNNKKSIVEKSKLAAQREAQILNAARAIFAKNGYRRTTIDQIAEYLNVGKGTIYRYFTDKKNLFLAVFEQGMGQLCQAIVSNVEKTDSPPEKFRMAVTAFFGFFDKNRDMIEIYMQVRSEFKPEYQQVYRDLYSHYIVNVQENMRKGIKMGIFFDMDVERTAEAYSGMLHGVLQGFYLREYDSDSEKPEMLADKAEAVLALLLNGILKKDV